MAANGRPRSTRLGRAVVAGGALLLVLGLLKDGIWLQLLGSLLLGARLAAALLDPGRGTPLRIQLQQPVRVNVHDPVDTVVLVDNLTRHRLPSVVIRISTAQLSDLTTSTASMGPAERATLRVSRAAHSRGLVDRHDVEFVTTDWFGFSQRRRPVTLLGTPAYVRPHIVAASWSTHSVGLGEWSGRRADRSGVEVLAVREWQGGDQLRHVHWRSTARRGQVMVTARAEPADDRCCVVVASVTGQRLSDELAGQLAGAALEELRAGRAVSLFAEQPGLAPLHHPHVDDVLDWCAQVAAPTLPSPATWTQVAGRVPTGHQVRLVTDVAPPLAWWNAATATAGRYGLVLEWTP